MYLARKSGDSAEPHNLWASPSRFGSSASQMLNMWKASRRTVMEECSNRRWNGRRPWTGVILAHKCLEMTWSPVVPFVIFALRDILVAWTHASLWFISLQVEVPLEVARRCPGFPDLSTLRTTSGFLVVCCSAWNCSASLDVEGCRFSLSMARCWIEVRRGNWQGNLLKSDCPLQKRHASRLGSLRCQ